MIPSIGRTVHYVFPNGEHRPAIIVRVWDKEPTEASVAQLQVFLDGTNDNQLVTERPIPPCVWRTSVRQDANGAPNTWHEPERV